MARASGRSGVGWEDSSPSTHKDSISQDVWRQTWHLLQGETVWFLFPPLHLLGLTLHVIGEQTVHWLRVKDRGDQIQGMTG